MTVLVTGASGFLGGALTRKLIHQGETVRVLIRQTSDLSHLDGLHIEFVYGDLADGEALAEAVRKTSTVFHCAARSSDWGTRSDFEQANVVGVKNLIAAAGHESSISRFVHVSTTDVFGYPRKSSVESLRPTDIGLPYNRTKVAGELLVREAGEAGLPVTIARPVTIFGPRSAEFAVEMARLLLDRGLPIIGGGKSQAGLIYVDDVAEALIAMAASPATIGKAYSLRDPAEMNWLKYISELAIGIGAELPRFNLPTRPAFAIATAMEGAYHLARTRRRPLLTRHAVYILTRPQNYPIDRAVADFGFAPTVGLKTGIEKTIAWLLSEEGQTALESG